MSSKKQNRHKSDISVWKKPTKIYSWEPSVPKAKRRLQSKRNRELTDALNPTIVFPEASEFEPPRKKNSIYSKKKGGCCDY